MHRAISTRQQRPQAGSVSLQLVIATPALLMLMLLIVQFALWQHAQHIAEAAAQEAVAATRVAGGSQMAGSTAAQAVLEHVGGAVIVGADVQVVRTATLARVEVLGHAVAVVPWVPLPVHAVAAAPIERTQAAAAQP